MAECPTGVLIEFDDPTEADQPLQFQPNCLQRTSTLRRLNNVDYTLNPVKIQLIQSISEDDLNQSVLDCSDISLLEDEKCRLVNALETDNDNEDLFSSAGGCDNLMQIYISPMQNGKSHRKRRATNNRPLSARQMAEVFTEATKVAVHLKSLNSSYSVSDSRSIPDFTALSPVFDPEDEISRIPLDSSARKRLSFVKEKMEAEEEDEDKENRKPVHPFALPRIRDDWITKCSTPTDNTEDVFEFCGSGGDRKRPRLVPPLVELTLEEAGYRRIVFPRTDFEEKEIVARPGDVRISSCKVDEEVSPLLNDMDRKLKLVEGNSPVEDQVLHSANLRVGQDVEESLELDFVPIPKDMASIIRESKPMEFTYTINPSSDTSVAKTESEDQSQSLDSVFYSESYCQKSTDTESSCYLLNDTGTEESSIGQSPEIFTDLPQDPQECSSSNRGSGRGKFFKENLRSPGPKPSVGAMRLKLRGNGSSSGSSGISESSIQNESSSEFAVPAPKMKQSALVRPGFGLPRCQLVATGLATVGAFQRRLAVQKVMTEKKPIGPVKAIRTTEEVKVKPVVRRSQSFKFEKSNAGKPLTPVIVPQRLQKTLGIKAPTPVSRTVVTPSTKSIEPKMHTMVTPSRNSKVTPSSLASSRNSQATSSSSESSRNSQATPSSLASSRNSPATSSSSASSRNSQAMPSSLASSRNSQATPSSLASARNSQATPSSLASSKNCLATPSSLASARNSQATPSSLASVRYSQATPSSLASSTPVRRLPMVATPSIRTPRLARVAPSTPLTGGLKVRRQSLLQDGRNGTGAEKALRSPLRNVSNSLKSKTTVNW